MTNNYAIQPMKYSYIQLALNDTPRSKLRGILVPYPALQQF